MEGEDTIRDNIETLGNLTGAQGFHGKFPSPDDFSPKSKPRRSRINE